MPDPLRIAAVSYANTYPFVFGIENSGLLKNFELLLLPPAKCFTEFASGNADIALIPAGALPSLKNFKNITDYCIGAVNEVKTVLLLSNKKISDIKSVGLDNESETSVRLVKVLAKHFWKINPRWLQMDVRNEANDAQTDAIVVIGDKALELQKEFVYKKDLAAEWQQFTGLPFVFAVWVGTVELSEEQVRIFSSALQYGLDHINDVINKYQPAVSPDFALSGYYKQNIDYHLDKAKNDSLQKFLNFIADL